MDKRPALRGVVSRRRAKATTCFILHRFRPPKSAPCEESIVQPADVGKRRRNGSQGGLVSSGGRGCWRGGENRTQGDTGGNGGRNGESHHALARDGLMTQRQRIIRMSSRHSAAPAVARIGTADSTRLDSGPNAVDSIPPSWGAGVPSPHH